MTRTTSLTPRQRPHGLRFELGMAANRAELKPEGRADWSMISIFLDLMALVNTCKLVLLGSQAFRFITAPHAATC